MFPIILFHNYLFFQDDYFSCVQHYFSSSWFNLANCLWIRHVCFIVCRYESTFGSQKPDYFLDNQALFAIYLCTYRYLYKVPNLSTFLGLGLTGTWMIIIILVFIMSLLQAVSACVASGVTCSNVCGNNSTVVVMEQPTALRQEIKIEITYLLVNLPQ